MVRVVEGSLPEDEEGGENINVQDEEDVNNNASEN